MNGYLDDGLDDQPYFNVSLDPGAFPTYTVVVYLNGDGQAGAVGRYWIEEWTDPLAPGIVITDQVGITSNSYVGTFEQAGTDFPQTETPADVVAASGNYLVFTNLTARNIRVRAAGNDDPEDFGRGPLNAIQILDPVVDPGGDSDNDGLLNVWEAIYGLDPESAVGEDGASGDPDLDGLTNFQEQAAKTNPVSDDSDSDGLKDKAETGGGTWNGPSDTGTNPLMADSDADGLLDGVEFNTGTFVDAFMTGTDPNVLDSDDDGLPDGVEVAAEIYPTDNGTTDVVNGPDGDPDADFSVNLEEFARGTDLANNDTDMDGVLDGYENLSGMFEGPTMTGTDPLNNDTDGDTLLDGVETGDGIFIDATETGTNPNLHDTDNDGYFDEQEVALGTNPNDPASKPALPEVLGFWSFDDQGATVTADLSANGNDGTVVGEPVYAPGHTSRAGDFSIAFDGFDDAVTTEFTLSNLPIFTMSGWVKFDSVQTDRSGLFGQNDIIEFGFTTGDNLQLWTNPGGAIAAPLPVSDDWVHIAVVGDATGRSIYLDGVEAVTGAAGSPLNASAFFFNIGGGGILDDTGNFFEGQIDDVAVWDTVFSPLLIKQLAEGTLTPVPSLGGGGLQITSIERDSGGRITLTIGGTAANVGYTLQGSTDLISWIEESDFTGADGSSTTTVSFIPKDVGTQPKAYFYVAPQAQ